MAQIQFQDETREQRNTRMRLYRATHKEELRAWAKKRRDSNLQPKRRAKLMGDRTCMFCEIRLAARSVRKHQQKYCQGCLNSPTVKRYLRALYIRRWRAKKKGLIPEKIQVVPQLSTRVGRPPIKNLVIHRDDQDEGFLPTRPQQVGVQSL